MLPKQHRLPASTRFHSAQVIKTPFFLLRVQKNNVATSRFGFVVSKRLDKRAIMRNRIKRVFRSCVEERISEITGANDFLFVLSPISLSTERTVLLNEIVKALQLVH